MNEVLNAIFSRHSVRSFKAEKLKREELELLLKAAAAAPTARNRQLNGFIALTNSETIDRLAELTGAVVGRDLKGFYKPAALIITYASTEATYGADDNACAMENIYLAAHSLGIGCVWINQLRDGCKDEKVREILRSVGVPDDCVVYGSAAVGYPAAAPAEIIRKAPISIVD